MLKILDHPILEHELGVLRNKDTKTGEFRNSLTKISQILCIEATRDAPTKEVVIETPLESTKVKKLTDNIFIIPVLRAGLGMMDAFVQMIPNVKIAYIGLKRNEKNYQTEEYHFSLPQTNEDSHVIILEVMVATGGSVCSTISRLKEEGLKNITLACVISAPEGLERIQDEHPDVGIITAALDRELNSKKYILPGLGDAGDRLHGTIF